jgi:3-(3-hydroxy-phenyl)propionate hydroxylase
VLFAGDSAHGVSPFGARGANSGVQDADNLGWKLKLVIDGDAPDALLDTYASEREAAADENIRHSTRSTDFITPKSDVSRVFRDAALRLAKDCAFARRIVNSGRLSTASVLHDSPLNTPDRDAFHCALVPGAVAADAPVFFAGHDGWFLQRVGSSFAGVLFGESSDALVALKDLRPQMKLVLIVPAGADVKSREGIEVLEDVKGLLAQRFDARPGTFYLLRPDQHIAMRVRSLEPHAVREALARATWRLNQTQPA